MTEKNLAVALIGFGGPEKPEEVRPFLESVLRGVKIPQARFDEVLRHYERMGGASPYNAITRSQQTALAHELTRRGITAPVFVAYRHSHPSFEEILDTLDQAGIQKAVFFVLTPLRSQSSFGKYADQLKAAQKSTRTENVSFIFTSPFHENPYFIEAQADEVAKAMGRLGPAEAKKAHYVFSAHSIPSAVAKESGYDRQFETICRLVAEKLGLLHWSVAYQSRSGNPQDPWLEPSVNSVLEKLDTSRFSSAVLIPAGFLCDNVEVLYDLDMEAREVCQSRGLHYERAKTVTDHPKFIRMAADLITQACQGSEFSK